MAKTDASNTFGNFNQTFNSTTFFLLSLLNRIGIGTTTPQNTLNVVGDINATTSIFSQDYNLTNGYLYALNGSLWSLNYSDYLNIRNYALNDSLWSLNYSTFLTKINWAQAVNGTILLSAQNSTINVNRSDGWDNLNTPSDITSLTGLTEINTTLGINITITEIQILI